MAEDCAMKDFSKDEWGLVLAGGGGKGAYQAGAFKALWEYGIQDYITAVSGASVGALNAVLFANKDIKAAGAACFNGAAAVPCSGGGSRFPSAVPANRRGQRAV